MTGDQTKQLQLITGDENFIEMVVVVQYTISDLGAYLNATRGLPAVEIRTPYHSVWLDNSKAKLSLGWRPQHDLARMVDEAWAYERAADEPRTVWYPG